MKLILDDIIDLELKNYLLTQAGIINVEFNTKDFISELKVSFDNEISPLTVLKFIELFQNNDYPTLLAFDKEININANKIEYVLDDICCEYCYKGLLKDLFVNEKIKSVSSNFDFNKPAFNIRLVIELYENYSDEDFIKYISDKIN